MIPSEPIPFTSPMECRQVNRLPDGPDWVYELKLDGYRAQAIRDDARVRLLSRNGNDFSRKFPQVFAALKEALPRRTAVDGELVAFDDTGRLSFNAMQNATAKTNVVFFVFDVLIHRGKDVTGLTLRERTLLLQSAFTASDRVQHSEQFDGPASRFVTAVRKMGGEGVVAKRLSSVYEAGRRSGAWAKLRLNMGQEFVIGGFTPGSNGIDALVVGFYDGKKLMYAARVRAGLIPATRQELHSRLKPLVTEVCPFANLPEATSGRWGQGLTAAKMKQCTWVKPRLVANCEFLEWTDSNHVRHIKFVALRDDKKALDVARE
ncbi:non-homologous end-joining DNA ligase [Occallatibacter riparius]|uniref:DNA ligase (ATP) n=1 Tax=Occallatibacter riparius TaxID=1002689 RepID=A0A9J7BQR9_9BACT|nr:non-homologous end-joining DNA ligase [Occallatibacter riparius]UWZ85163.1 non-homologous end-joining DNA ligase [Occallatibacter riparius]